ncbi:cell division protein FtsK, partial [Enterococcus faecalis]
ICDPNNSDLMALGRLPLFGGKGNTGKTDIVNCIKNAGQEMEDRFKTINESPKFKLGKNYDYYGLKPKFIVVD